MFGDVETEDSNKIIEVLKGNKIKVRVGGVEI